MEFSCICKRKKKKKTLLIRTEIEDNPFGKIYYFTELGERRAGKS